MDNLKEQADQIEMALRIRMMEQVITDLFNSEFVVELKDREESEPRMLDISEEFAVLSMMLLKRAVFLSVSKEEFINRMSQSFDMISASATINAPSTHEMQ